MKVDRPGGVGATGRQKARKKADATGAKFEIGKSTVEQPVASVSGLGPVAAVDALLATQEVGGDSTSRRSRAYQTAEDMLDLLQDVQKGLLLGGIPLSRLRRLEVLVAKQRVAETNSELEQVLEEVELRVAVELAKLGYGA
jgi:hypothetical protein